MAAHNKAIMHRQLCWRDKFSMARFCALRYASAKPFLSKFAAYGGVNCMNIKNIIIINLCIIALCSCVSKLESKEKGARHSCCEAYGLDVTPILGEKGIDCGVIYSGRAFKAELQRANNRAISCANKCKAKGLPFVVGNNWVGLPDGSGRDFAIYSDSGQKILLSEGEFNSEGWYYFESCNNIEIKNNGAITGANCTSNIALYESLKIKR